MEPALRVERRAGVLLSPVLDPADMPPARMSSSRSVPDSARPVVMSAQVQDVPANGRPRRSRRAARGQGPVGRARAPWRIAVLRGRPGPRRGGRVGRGDRVGQSRGEGRRHARHPLRGRIRLQVPHGHRRDGARRPRAAAPRHLRRPGAGERPTARHVDRIGDAHPAPGPHVGRPSRVALRVSRPPGNDRHACAPDSRRRVPRGSTRTALPLYQPRLRCRGGAHRASGRRAVPAGDGARALLAARHARHHG